MMSRIELIERKLKKNGIAENSIKGYLTMLHKIERQEMKLSKHIADFNKNDFLDILFKVQAEKKKTISGQTGSRMTLYRRQNQLNTILKLLELDHLCITKDDIDINVIADNNTNLNDFFTLDEIKNICNTLTNPQDKFIIYSLFLGIGGKEAADIRGLKKQNINLKDRKIYILGKTIKIDDYFYNIVKDTLETDVYIAKNGKEYKFNSVSDYVLKPRPTSKNGDGIGQFSYNGLRTRIRLISQALGLMDNEGEGRCISPVNLIRSGVIHQIYQETKGSKISNEKIREFISDKNLNMDPMEIYRIYNKKYNIL